MGLDIDAFLKLSLIRTLISRSGDSRQRGPTSLPSFANAGQIHKKSFKK